MKNITTEVQERLLAFLDHIRIQTWGDQEAMEANELYLLLEPAKRGRKPRTKDNFIPSNNLMDN